MKVFSCSLKSLLSLLLHPFHAILFSSTLKIYDVLLRCLQSLCLKASDVFSEIVNLAISAKHSGLHLQTIVIDASLAQLTFLFF